MRMQIFSKTPLQPTKFDHTTTMKTRDITFPNEFTGSQAYNNQCRKPSVKFFVIDLIYDAGEGVV